MSERFTLDVPSFEKFLAAAWVLQYRRDQELLNLSSDEGVASPTGTQTAEPPSEFPRAVEIAIYASANLTNVQGELEALYKSPAVEPVRIGPTPIELDPDEHSKFAPMPQSVEVKLPVTRTSEDDLEDSRPKPTFDYWAVVGKLGQRLKSRRHTFRVSLPARAIHSVAIVAPILALAILSAWLLLEARRHRSPQSSQVILQPGPQAEAAVNSGSPPPAIMGQNASQKFGETTNPVLPLPTTVASLQTSHLQVTDASVRSFVSALSPYEIRGLRRRARYGDPSATFALGMVFETGRHVRQSCRQAARWVHKAAAAGNSAAQYNLALRYRTGDGVRTNAVQSRKWLRKAARRDPKAKIALNLMASR